MAYRAEWPALGLDNGERGDDPAPRAHLRPFPLVPGVVTVLVLPLQHGHERIVIATAGFGVHRSMVSHGRVIAGMAAHRAAFPASISYSGYHHGVLGPKTMVGEALGNSTVVLRREERGFSQLVVAAREEGPG